MGKNMTTSVNWQSDPLGEAFEQAPLETSDGAVATLVRYLPSTSESTPRKVAILYLHGFTDYFFHPHVAQALAEAGYAFYALDLRGYGRSMQAHVEAGGDPNMVNEVGVHARDLDAAAEVIRAQGHEKLVLLAHSMGGLVGTLWANGARPDSGLRADALILNAPWFDLNESEFLRGPGTAAVSLLAELVPRAEVGGVEPHYHKALHQDLGGGEWKFNLDWKPAHGFPVQAAWFSSIRRAHKRIMSGLVDLRIPVLVLASTRSGSAKVWHPEVLTTDSVLNVEHMAAGASQIGTDVTFVQIPGGAHDLALSRGSAREEYLATILKWLKAKEPA
jgi:alpha-beta hydrolase superfamily lysophospholipase